MEPDSTDLDRDLSQPPLGGDGAPPTASASPSIVQRIAWTFSSPRKACRPPFRRSDWLIPFIVMSLIQVTTISLTQPIRADATRTMIEQNDKVPDQQKEQMIEQMTNASPRVQAFQAVGGVIAYLLIGLILPAAVYLFLLNFVLGARTRFLEVLTVLALTALVVAPGMIVRTIIMLGTGSIHVYTSPAALVSGDQKVLVTALNCFDVFTILGMFVLALGFSGLTGLPVRKTAWPVLALWLVAGLIGIGFAASPLGQWMP